MATSPSPAAVAPAQHLNQILGRKPRIIPEVKNIIKKNNSEGIRIISSWNFRRNFNCQRSHFCNHNNARVLYDRGFPSISSVALPVIPHSHHPFRSNRLRLRVFDLPLFPLRRSRSPPLWAPLMSHNDGSTAPQDSSKTVRCVIKGRVQGVFYRDWTVESATQLGLKGWVRNRRDGSVEVLFSGKPEAVEEMQQRCRRGPPDAMVTGFEAYPCNEDPGTGFERRRTV